MCKKCDAPHVPAPVQIPITKENSPNPGHMWRECDCHEIHPIDTPCLTCEARFEPMPPAIGSIVQGHKVTKVYPMRVDEKWVWQVERA